ncbi:hypothetical protein RHS01_03566 [Rhizoctonia solani]|uniref:Retrotransposon gag domain-containing protein n=1 Tax=Rhizoctonia solani TaxID=456999 RepID=A0A8H7M8J6_9AGAM|nr:hypothetical protein RHS01_03566 [Rhizoctonia solani]
MPSQCAVCPHQYPGDTCVGPGDQKPPPGYEQNLSLVIGQAAAHHTDIGTTQATLNNHDSSITNLDALIVKLGADIAKIGTAAASGSSIALATKAPKLARQTNLMVDEQIAFIISCLDGKAHEWLEPYLEEDVVKGNPVSWLHNLDAFWLQFNARWNVQNRTENFRAKLRTLKQTKGVQDYYKDFQTYSQGLGYNDPSLRDMFYDGLSHKIKETLMVQDYDHADASVTLATLAEKALKVDQRLEQFAAQHKGSSSSSNQSGSKSSTSTSAAAQGAPRDKLSVGEQDNHPATATPLLLPRLPPPPPAQLWSFPMDLDSASSKGKKPLYAQHVEVGDTMPINAPPNPTLAMRPISLRMSRKMGTSEH